MYYNDLLYISLIARVQPHPVPSLFPLVFIFETASSDKRFIFFFKRFIILRGDLRWFEIPTHISFTAIYQLYGFSIKYVREVSKFLLANGAQPFNQAINSLFSVYSIRRIHYLLNYKQRAYLFYLKLHNVFEILFLFFMATLLKMYVYKIKISFIQLTNVY